jgi:excisionase family DNA binding protein
MKTYTVKQAAEILHYNIAYLAQKLSRGEIEATKIGGKWLIKESTILKLLEV